MNTQCLSRRPSKTTLLCFLLVLVPTMENAFDQGRTIASVMVSPGRQLDRDYTVPGARFGRYFVQDF